ncbi:MAG: MBL fold metallo-hydrolase [Candidatus Omnitrophica bacterium]|nr:MBL fold metallo-hydrolase [Candidatus Omnitrophota bacterium]
MILKRIIVGNVFTNCYIIGCEEKKECGIIDPGAEPEKINKIIENEKLKPIMIINTHGHFDHIGGNNFFAIPVYIHKDDVDFLKDPDKNLSSIFSSPYICKNKIVDLNEGDIIKIGKIAIEVLHTPGHTPGSICLKIDNIFFSGDTVFANGIGRTDFPFGDEEVLFKSIKEKILILPDEIKVYPGHGDITTIKYIKEWLILI